MTENHLLILAGPSCAGKTPLRKAFEKFYPQRAAQYEKIVLYNSRPKRPGEQDGVDYYFRDAKHLEKMKSDPDSIVMEVRQHLQAVRISELLSTVKNTSMIYEGNTFTARRLATDKRLIKIRQISVFISPLSAEEISFIKAKENLEDIIQNLMLGKLIRRAQNKFHFALNKKRINNLLSRAQDAYEELKSAHSFDYVIPNHDGEESVNWDQFSFPLGEARKSVLALKDIVDNRKNSFVEKWEKNLLS